MSSAGSTACHDRTSSTYSLVAVENCANASCWLAGQIPMPFSKSPSPPSNCVMSLGPLTTAPTAELCARLDTWCCMHFGYVDPSPTMKLVPHALAPKSQSRCWVAKASYDASCAATLYSASLAINPKVCESTSKLL